MKIGQTVWIVTVTRRFPPDDYCFQIDSRWVISFDEETMIVASDQGYAGSYIHIISRRDVFECPFEAAENIDRFMAEFDSQGRAKVKDSQRIAAYLAKYESDQPSLVEKR